MVERADWFPIDTRILPFNLSLVPPRSRWVKRALVLEIFLSFLSVVGALLLTILTQ